MAYLLLFVLAVTEVGSVVFEVAGNPVKNVWSRRRVVTSGMELCLFILALRLPGIDPGFRFRCLLFLLVARIVLAGVAALIQRQNRSPKRKGMIVLNGLVSILLIALSMVPAFLFAEYSGRPLTGAYTVGQTRAILRDPSRVEAYETDNSCREVPVYFYYPEELIREVDEANSLPLVIFSHGAFGYYQSNASTYMELASHGYIVVSMDHPYHSFFTKDSAGKTIVVDSDFMRTVLAVGGDTETGLPEEEVWEITSGWMKLRIEDMNFVIDTLQDGTQGVISESWCFPEDSGECVEDVVSCIDPGRIGLMGHSLGGATAVSVGRREDIGAVIDLDGTMLGEELGVRDGRYVINEEPYVTPLLCIDNQEHHDDRMQADIAGYNYANNVILGNASEGFATYFAGAGHMNYTDLPLFAPALAKQLGTGEIDPAECIDQMNAIVLRFFDCYLKNEGVFQVSESY